jgi:hypothetical protein
MAMTQGGAHENLDFVGRETARPRRVVVFKKLTQAGQGPEGFNVKNRLSTVFLTGSLMVSASAVHSADVLLCIHSKDGTVRAVSATSCKSNEMLVALPKVDRIEAAEARITNTESAISSQTVVNRQQDDAIAALEDELAPSGAVITPPRPPFIPGSQVDISFNSSHVKYDTDSYVRENHFVIPFSGIYLLSMIGTNQQDGSFAVLYYSVNGAEPLGICVNLGDMGLWPLCNGSELLKLNSGDTITFRAYSSSNNLAFLRIGISKQ